MGELFKQSILESISDRIKDDTYELDVLKSNYNIEVHQCCNANNELYESCKKRHIKGDDVKKGAQCPTCKLSFCSMCFPINMVNCAVEGLVCLKCWLGPDEGKGMVKCNMCNNNTFANSLIKTHRICLECKTIIPL